MKADLEALLAHQIRAIGLPAPARNYQFAAEAVGHGPGIKRRLAEAGLRNFQIDFCWPGIVIGKIGRREVRFGVEVDGLSPKGGGHQSIAGAKRDREKWLQALELGWVVLPVHGGQVKTGAAVNLIEQVLCPGKKRRLG